MQERRHLPGATAWPPEPNPTVPLNALGQITFSHLGHGAETGSAVVGFAAGTADVCRDVGQRVAHSGAQMRGEGSAQPVWQA